MRRLFRRLAEFYGRHAIAIDLALITMGAGAVKRRLEDVHSRLDELEHGGLVPRDDLVTLRDLETKVGPVLQAHQTALRDAGLLYEDPQAPVDVEAPERQEEELSEPEQMAPPPMMP